MKYNQLGNSELEVSEVSFGCMSLKRADEPNPRILREAYENGINFFDTADLYEKGWNEEFVGKALQPIRDNVILATKAGNEWRKDGSGWEWNPSKKYILSAIDESLRRLQTDYIDLYQLHGGTIDDPMDETIEAFEILKGQGKIREYGISSIRPNVIREWADRSNMVSVMMQYSLLDRRPEETCLDLLAGHGISVITRGSLAKGMLVNKAATDYLGYSGQQVKSVKELIEQTQNPITSSLRFVLRHDVVDSAVVGFRTDVQMHEVVEAMKLSVTENELSRMKTTLEPNRYELHR